MTTNRGRSFVAGELSSDITLTVLEIASETTLTGLYATPQVSADVAVISKKVVDKRQKSYTCSMDNWGLISEIVHQTDSDASRLEHA